VAVTRFMPDRHNDAFVVRKVGVAIAISVFALAVAGCSVTTRIGSLFGDEEEAETTASTPNAADDLAAPLRSGGLSPRMNDEDTRRSQSALALALDPEGKGALVNWDNPSTGATGSFSAEGDFYIKSNQLCRAFRADLAYAGANEQFQGKACRAGPGAWAILEADQN
jgi:surface antigen